MLKFLRRDPTLWITLVQGVVSLALAFHLFGITAVIAPLIMAVVNGVAGLVTAILTKRSGFAVATGLITALINLFAGYGLTLDDTQTSAVMLLATVIMGIFGWSANSPADVPGLHEEPVVSPSTVINQTFTSQPDVDAPDEEPSPYSPTNLGGSGGNFT